MKFIATLFFGLSFFFCFSQNQHTGLLIDNETQESLEFVNIYNSSDYTVSNQDGRYSFSSLKDSITFYRVGYDKLETRFNQLKDTVFLKKSIFELNEVIVTNAKNIYQKIKDSVASNYLLTPHSEVFSLRTLLKRNDSIVRIQDIHGIVKRKTSLYGGGLKLEKDDFEVKIQNMRKIGVSKDENSIYFQFPSLFNIFSEFVRINAMGPDFEVTEQLSDQEDFTWVDFNAEVADNKCVAMGHYIINSHDNAILSFNIELDQCHPSSTNSKNITSKLISNKVAVFFKEDLSHQLYYMNAAKRDAKISIIGPDDYFSDVYEMQIILATSESFGDEKIKSNTKEHKDLFKLKHKYDASYWNSQNQLLLTNEMQEFIKRMGTNNKEFKVKNNMN